MKNITRGLIALLGLLCISQPGFGQTAEPTQSPPSQTADSSSPGGKRAREFQGDDLGQVLRLLARQAKISLMVDEAIKGTINMRLENNSAMEAIEAIAHSRKLLLTQDDKGIYYINPPDAAHDRLEFIARPETANRIAAYKHHLYAALIQQGFTNDEALKIVLASSFNEFIPSLAEKPDVLGPK